MQTNLIVNQNETENNDENVQIESKQKIRYFPCILLVFLDSFSVE